MQIIIIRHAKVDMSWDKEYNSATYDLACDRYNECPIISVSNESSAMPIWAFGECREGSNIEYSKIDDTKTVYISELSRTYETACRLFKNTDFVRTALLNEVPLKSFKDTNKNYPLWFWNFAGRLQWFLQSKRQMESKEETVIRAKEMMKLLEERWEDCYLVTHGFFMRVFMKELKKQGYKIQKNKFFGISNLDMVVAMK